MSQWNLIKLELARTAEFPEGSPSRSYLLWLPLLADGTIDEEARLAAPQRATVRRFWPSQADQAGYIIRNGNGWAFSYSLDEGDAENLCHLENHTFKTGSCLTVMEPGGDWFPYRVTSIVDD